MIYGFDTKNREAGLAALLVYGMYRSKDPKRNKSAMDMWSKTIPGAVSGCAMRAVDLWEFIEKLKNKKFFGEPKPKWMKVGDNPVINMYVNHETGEIIQKGEQWQVEKREFWVEILDSADHESVLFLLSNRTSYIIALVRDRLEREKPYEIFIQKESEENKNGEEE